MSDTAVFSFYGANQSLAMGCLMSSCLVFQMASFICFDLHLKVDCHRAKLAPPLLLDEKIQLPSIFLASMMHAYLVCF